MTPSFDPPRLASGGADACASLRDALKSASNDGPTQQDLAKLSGMLAPVFMAPPSSFPDVGSNGLSESASASAKLLGAGFGKGATMLAVAAVCAAGGYGAWRALAPSSTATQNIAPAPVVQPLALPAKEPIRVDQLPIDDTKAPGDVTPQSAASRPREATRARPIELPASNLAAEEVAAGSPKPQLSEWALIELARKSGPTDPRNALALAQDHHRRFAGGPLSEEADFIEIEAMKRLGRFEDARSLEERFRKRYPNSMHGQTVHVQPTPNP